MEHSAPTNTPLVERQGQLSAILAELSAPSLAYIRTRWLRHVESNAPKWQGIDKWSIEAVDTERGLSLWLLQAIEAELEKRDRGEGPEVTSEKAQMHYSFAAKGLPDCPKGTFHPLTGQRITDDAEALKVAREHPFPA